MSDLGTVLAAGLGATAAFGAGDFSGGIATKRDPVVHLKPGSSLVFDTRLPQGYDLSLDPLFVDAGTYVDPRGRRVRYLEKQARYDPTRGVLGIEMKRVLPDGTERLTGIDLKFTSVDRLTDLVDESGFELVGAYGSWRRDPLERNGVNVVMDMKR